MEGEWVDRLEKRFGFLAAPDLPRFIVGMTVLVALLGMIKPEFTDALALDPVMLLRGQVWRMVGFLITPPLMSPLWLILWVAMLYAILQALDGAWGAFKLTVFVAIGMLATTAGALATGAALDDSILILAAFLAFARLMPDREMLIMFVLPVKMRWLAALTAVWLAVEFVAGGATTKVWLLTGLSPYLLFFGSGHARDLSLAWRRWRQNRP